jgi:two-component system, OmpR family, alkaline phosphatase synthesis response regulator PhoP
MPKKIVIVDDENDIREILRHAIELIKDWTVLEAKDGASGLELIGREKPDAILLDVMMPNMDGREVFRRLRENPATTDIPTIFITASLQRAEVRALEELGPIAVLAKPFDPLEIVRKISDLLGW